jgi:hypothetical protein
MEYTGNYRELREQEEQWLEGFNRGLFYGIVVGMLIAGMAYLLYRNFA